MHLIVSDHISTHVRVFVISSSEYYSIAFKSQANLHLYIILLRVQKILSSKFLLVTYLPPSRVAYFNIRINDDTIAYINIYQTIMNIRHIIMTVRGLVQSYSSHVYKY